MTIFYSQQFATAPNEIWHWTISINHDTDAGAEAPAVITHMNDALLSQIDMQPLESFTFKGANNEDVQGFMIKPPGFDPAKKYPLKFLIHGGPQGAWGNSWTYRWNAELFAANGYVVVMINFHGSTGYGQKFTDSISGDWGGKPYVDLMKGLDYVEKTYPFIDKNREAALGASYGGYMANWIARPHQSLQMHRVARRHVQRGVSLRHDRGVVVQRVGVQRPTVEKSRTISEILAAFVRRQIQNADAGCPRTE